MQTSYVVRQGASMRKKFVYAGIVLILAAIAILLLGAGLVPQPSSFTLLLFNVTPGNFVSMPINITPLSTIVLRSLSSSPINLYVMNGSAFLAWGALMRQNGNGLEDANSLSGSGALFIQPNNTSISIPSFSYSTNYTGGSPGSAPSYGAGRYYVVLDNTNGSASSNSIVRTEVVIPDYLMNGTSEGLAQLNSFSSEAEEMGFVMVVVGVIGIIVLFYGIISKAKNLNTVSLEKNREDLSEESLDRLYGTARKKRSATRRKRKAKR